MQKATWFSAQESGLQLALDRRYSFEASWRAQDRHLASLAVLIHIGAQPVARLADDMQAGYMMAV